MGTQLAYLLIDLHARNLEGLFFQKIGSDKGKKVTVTPPFSFFKAYSRKVGKKKYISASYGHKVCGLKKLLPDFLAQTLFTDSVRFLAQPSSAHLRRP